MAEDWLKVSKDTPEKAEVMALADLLGISLGDAFLACFRVWRWADSNTVDGKIPHVTAARVDELSHLPGFAHALSEVGWLRVRTGALEIPNFGRHMGQTGKQRALTSKRAAAYRSRHGEVTHEALRDENGTVCVSSSLSSLFPEEEKNQEKNPTPRRGGGAGGGEGFTRFWAVYPQRTAKQAAVRAWNKLRPDAALVETILAAVERQKGSERWRRGVIPHPGTWLNGRRWEDEPSAGGGKETAAEIVARLSKEQSCPTGTDNGRPGTAPSSG